jgi:putative restriction endonuclease
MTDFAGYLAKFQDLNCGRVGSHERPHKPVMLLSVLDLAESGQLIHNRIYLGPQLLELFRRYFDIVRTDTDQPTPINPFFYLRGDEFWHHQVHPGQEAVYRTMSNPGGMAMLNSVVAYAWLDNDLHAAIIDPVKREQLRQALITRYFAPHQQAIMAVVEREKQIGIYERFLDQSTLGKVAEPATPPYNNEIRDTGFRRIVTRAYDYRCAACGLRVYLDDGRMLVEAAHLVPFAETHDDNPCNGMALCKNHHWAMDQFLIAPGPDHRWHVSQKLDDRLEGQQDLLQLQDRTVLLPGDTRYHPRKESLEWRTERLLAGRN